MEEVLRALKQKHPTKMPGLDGMPTLFYQAFWDIVGVDIINYVLHILNNGGRD